MTIAEVELWGRTIGAVSWDPDRELGFFEYDAPFVASGIQVAPLVMPLTQQIYSFPALPRDSFYGLPGLLADSLPDRFGNTLIDAWLATQGRRPESFNPVERLCYTGTRGMGALEFAPPTVPPNTSEPLALSALVELASEVLTQRSDLRASLADPSKAAALRDILRVGTSAGGARAKAVIAWNPETQEVRSGQLSMPAGFTYWLLKFDGVAGNRDKELDDPSGFGLIEFAYHHMATAAGIEMSECRILSENNRHHFMTRRFDRTDNDGKLHMQTLGALAHFDFNQAGAHSYEQAMHVMRRIGLPMSSIEQQFRRVVFNVLARNQDDHVKNIAYLMDKSGTWSLSPAYDLTYSYNPDGKWTAQHQMSLNGKRNDFELADFISLGKTASMKRGRARAIVAEVGNAIAKWPEFATAANVPEDRVANIGAAHRIL